MKRISYLITAVVLLIGTITVVTFSSFKKDAPRAVITTIYDVSGNVIATAPAGNAHWTDNMVSGSNPATLVAGSNNIPLYGEPNGVTRAYFRP